MVKTLPRALRSPLYHACWAGPAAVVLALGLAQPAVVTRMQDQLFDAYQRAAPRAFDPTAPVRIVDVDDASLSRLGQWPWPRTRIAALIDRLKGAGAAAVAFDIVFSERDRTDALIAGIADETRRLAVRSALGGMPDGDDALAEAIGTAPVVLGLVLTQNGAGILPDAPYGFAHTGSDPLAAVPLFSGAVVPLPALAGRAGGLGAVNWLPDGDQTVRRVPLLLGLGGRLVPSLAMEALRVAQGASTFLVRAREAGGIEAVRIGALTVDASDSGDTRVRFTPHVPERFIPAWRVLDAGFEPATIAGRIVVVGSSSAGLTDVRATPVDPAMPGVEVQAQAIEGLLGGTALSRPSWWRIEIAVAAALAVIVAATLPLAPAIASAGLALSLVLGIAAASWWAFVARHWLIDPAMPGLGVLAAFGGGLAAMFRAEQRDRRFVVDAFGRFVSPAVVDRLAREPGLLTLGGELRPLTVMFTDVRDFAAIAERMDASALTRLMNRYLSPMSELVLAHGGTVDKYVGDAIMAFWNAPLPDPRHAERAARAALAMLATLPSLAGETAAVGLPPIRCGVGLASGPCVVGNLGSHLRFDYSALGDDVNLASRLEGLTKTYGVDVLASASVRDAAPHLAWLAVDRVAVAGRQATTALFTLAGDEAVAAMPDFAALVEANEAMLRLYRERRFADALAVAEALRIGAGIGAGFARLFAFHAARCRAYIAAPPAPVWDAVTRWDRK